MIDLVCLFAAYVVSQFYRSFLAVLSPLLVEQLGVTTADLSNAQGAWFLAFAIAQFPVGVALDRIGPRRTVGWTMLLGAGGGALVFASASGAAGLVLGMALIGIGCSPILMAGMFIFARTYGPERFATLSGMMIGVGALGNLLGAAPLAYVVEAFGWRGVVAVLAGLAAVIAAGVLAGVRDPERISAPGDGALGGVGEVLRARALWALLPLAFFNYAVSAGIRGLWAGPYLTDVHGMSVVAIGAATTWMAAAMIAGAFLVGPALRFVRSHKRLILCLNGTGAACALGLSFGVGETAAVALMAAIGICGASYPALMSHARAFIPAHLTGRGVTVLNFFNMIGVGAGQFFTGRISEAAGDAASADAYRGVFLYYGVTLICALAIYLFSRDAKS